MRNVRQIGTELSLTDIQVYNKFQAKGIVKTATIKGRSFYSEKQIDEIKEIRENIVAIYHIYESKMNYD